MIKLNIHEAKTHLSRYLARLKAGEVIVLCRRNIPVAEIRPLARVDGKRRIGAASGKLKVPASFFKPLPENVLKEFEGRG